MEQILEIAKYILPSLVVFGSVYYVMNTLLANEQRKQRLELNKANQRNITPLRLQAFERLVLFLERISPENLLLRVHRPGMTTKELQMEMLASIRTEFEHNLAQQIYMTDKAWTVITSAKENMVKLVNTSAERLNPQAPAIELSKLIIQMMMSVEESPIKTAIELVKDEVREIYEV